MRGDMRPRLETPALICSLENAWTEEARRNRCANFRLRGVLGMLARVRHAAYPRRTRSDLRWLASTDKHEYRRPWAYRIATPSEHDDAQVRKANEAIQLRELVPRDPYV